MGCCGASSSGHYMAVTLGNGSSDDLYKSDPSAIRPRGKGPIRPFPEDLEAVNG